MEPIPVDTKLGTLAVHISDTSPFCLALQPGDGIATLLNGTKWAGKANEITLAFEKYVQPSELLALEEARTKLIEVAKAYSESIHDLLSEVDKRVGGIDISTISPVSVTSTCCNTEQFVRPCIQSGHRVYSCAHSVCVDCWSPARGLKNVHKKIDENLPVEAINIGIDCHLHKTDDNSILVDPTFRLSVKRRRSETLSPPKRLRCQSSVFASPFTDNQLISTARGTLYALGSSSGGFLDRPTLLDFPHKPQSISIGEGYTLICTTDGQCYGIGRNSFNMLGDTAEKSVDTFVPIHFPKGSHITSVHAGDTVSYALSKYGQVYHWGMVPQFSKCFRVPTLLDMNVPIVNICVAETFVLFLSKCGYVHRVSKTTGEMTTFNSLYPFYKVKTGGNHALLLSNSGEIYGYGSNECGQLGFKQECTWIDHPRRIPTLDGTPIKTMACGGRHSIVVGVFGKTYVFGDNSKRQLGIEDEPAIGDLPAKIWTTIWTPTQFNKLSLLNIAKVTCGKNHTVVMTKSDGAFGFGSNKYGQLGVPPSQLKKTHYLTRIDLFTK